MGPQVDIFEYKPTTDEGLLEGHMIDFFFLCIFYLGERPSRAAEYAEAKRFCEEHHFDITLANKFSTPNGK